MLPDDTEESAGAADHALRAVGAVLRQPYGGRRTSTGNGGGGLRHSVLLLRDEAATACLRRERLRGKDWRGTAGWQGWRSATGGWQGDCLVTRRLQDAKDLPYAPSPPWCCWPRCALPALPWCHNAHRACPAMPAVVRSCSPCRARLPRPAVAVCCWSPRRPTTCLTKFLKGAKVTNSEKR